MIARSRPEPASHTGRSDWIDLARLFATGTPVTPRTGLTRAHYLMSYAGTIPFGPRTVDGLVGELLHRWWQGHRFYADGREGIANTSPACRRFWRIAFPWYPRTSGVRGDELWDFHVDIVPGTIDPDQLVTGLDWYAAPSKFAAPVRRPAQLFFRWFAWNLTRSELVELTPGGTILARVTWRAPGTSKWWVTSYYTHRWIP